MLILCRGGFRTPFWIAKKESIISSNEEGLDKPSKAPSKGRKHEFATLGSGATPAARTL